MTSQAKRALVSALTGPARLAAIGVVAASLAAGAALAQSGSSSSSGGFTPEPPNPGPPRVVGGGDVPLQPLDPQSQPVTLCDPTGLWQPRAIEFQHQVEVREHGLGEILLCEQANREFLNQVEAMCGARVGLPGSFRNLTARALVGRPGFNCHCTDSRLFNRCRLSGGAVCSFEQRVGDTPRECVQQ